MRPSDLADQIGLSRSATTRLVDRLERSGLVARRACASDRRGSFVVLTPRGEGVFRDAGRVHLRGIDEHVGSHLTNDELAQLSALLGKLADSVGGAALSTLTRNTST
jgi:DNA-binding MarR family transcriptional regulator